MANWVATAALMAVHVDASTALRLSNPASTPGHDVRCIGRRQMLVQKAMSSAKRAASFMG